MTDRPKRRRTVLVVLALVIVQAVAVVLYLRIEANRHTEAAEPFRFERVNGPTLEAIVLARADGTTLPTTMLRGRPVLLHFWATWCAPCREELPVLLKLQAEHPDIQVIALTLDDEWAKVRTFFNGAIPSAVFRDLSGTLATQYGVGALPDTYLLDRNGVATLRFGGARNWSSQEAHDALTRQ